jgi:pimeloyl-ACP methyl ester carboxylesterase
MPAAAGIYYTHSDRGQKDLPPVILIHGTGSNHSIWPAEIRRLPGQRVFAIDLPGHGHTPGFGLQSISDYADLMVEFLAALGLYQAVFVGHSMGGAVALEMACRHSNHVAGLGLIATGAYLGVSPEMLDDFSNAFTLSGAFHAYQQRAFGPAAAPLLIERIMAMHKETRPSVLAADWQACAEFDIRMTANQISAPAWVIVGSEDRLTPVAFAHFLAGRLPAARLQIVPNAGHMVIVERPVQVAQGLQQFLAALTAARFTAAKAKGSGGVLQPGSIDQHAFPGRSQPPKIKRKETDSLE